MSLKARSSGYCHSAGFALTRAFFHQITTIYEKKSIVLLPFAFVTINVIANAAVTARSLSKNKLNHSRAFAWSRLIGIGVDIKFGQNAPKCKCCYGGLCELKVSSGMIQNGPLSDNQIANFANNLLANYQAGVGITESGEAYLIFNRAISRPEFSGAQLAIQSPVAWDPVLISTYGIPQMLPGNYDIIDNGLFKMVRIH